MSNKPAPLFQYLDALKEAKDFLESEINKVHELRGQVNAEGFEDPREKEVMMRGELSLRTKISLEEINRAYKKINQITF